MILDSTKIGNLIGIRGIQRAKCAELLAEFQFVGKHRGIVLYLFDFVDVDDWINEPFSEEIFAAGSAGAVNHLENGIASKNIQIVRKIVRAVDEIIAAVKG